MRLRSQSCVLASYTRPSGRGGPVWPAARTADFARHPRVSTHGFPAGRLPARPTRSCSRTYRPRRVNGAPSGPKSCCCWPRSST